MFPYLNSPSLKINWVTLASSLLPLEIYILSNNTEIPFSLTCTQQSAAHVSKPIFQAIHFQSTWSLALSFFSLLLWLLHLFVLLSFFCRLFCLVFVCFHSGRTHLSLANSCFIRIPCFAPSYKHFLHELFVDRVCISDAECYSWRTIIRCDLTRNILRNLCDFLTNISIPKFS